MLVDLKLLQILD